MTAADKPGLLPLSEALERMLAGLAPVADEGERIPLAAALDRILAADVTSPIDVPGHRNSAMDGYAVLGQELPSTGEVRLRVAGTALAGHPFAGRVNPGEAVRIMTGAVVPEGADTVVMQEATRREEASVVIGGGQRAGDNVRHPGEDIARGAVVLKAGRRLLPFDVGLLASLGVAEVGVRRRLRVAFFSTGDELVPPGKPLAPGQIYDSNRYTLAALLTRMGIEAIDLGLVPDRRDAVEAAFNRAASEADAVITSGGVSVGEADFVKETLERLGRVNFWKVAMKPGKPLAFGQLGKAAFFGLPGNPVAVVTTFYQLVQPALRRLSGEAVEPRFQLRVPCSESLRNRSGRLDFQRGILEMAPDGQLMVRSTGAQGSHILSSMSHANCYIVLPAETVDYPKGTPVTVEPFAAFV